MKYPRYLRSLESRRRALNERRSGMLGGGGGSAAGLSSFLPAPVMSGIAVTPETALTLTAVFAAINVISTDTAGLPLRVIRQLRGGGKVPVPRDPRYNLVYCEPNEDTTSIRFRQALLGHTLSWGNSFARIERLGNGDPAALHMLSPRPTDTRPVRDRSGRLWYETEGGRGPTLMAEDVAHIAGLGWDGILGYSPIAFARQAVGLGLAAEQYGASFFGNGATPLGVIKFPGKLNKEGQNNLRESWDRVHQGTINANRTAVLVEGAAWERISIPPEDAQFLETRKFQVIEIARLYRIPPHKLGDYSQSHLSNIEASNLDYLNTTLAPWLETIEQELNKKLFTARERAHGLHVAHDLTALLRGDMKARAEYYRGLFGVAAISPDEVREREGLNPIPDGKGRVFLQPLNLAPLGTAPEAPASTQADPGQDTDSDTQPGSGTPTS